MSHLIPFKFEESAIRVLEIAGEPWFVAKDVAEVLGYADPKNAVNRHCKGAKEAKGGETPPFDLHPQTLIIPERDVYRLVIRSKLPAAERFEEWVVGEVLPSIRKTGSYQHPSSVAISASDLQALTVGLYDLKREVAELRTARDPRLAVGDYISLNQLLREEFNVPPRKRRSLQSKLFRRLMAHCLVNGIKLRRSPHTVARTWLFPVDEARRFLHEHCRGLINDHVAAVTGQGVLQLVRLPKATVKEEERPNA